MSVELQTGTECLVSDASDAELYAGIQGAGNYILRKPLELSMIDSNTLSVGAGTGLQNGRHIRFKGTTEFSIPSGVQAQKRSNIAVVRTTISRDESTMKTLTHSEPIVLSGEPVAEGDPGDPAWIEGDLLAGDTVADFPIARVVTDGINVGEPEPLFDVLQSAKDRWDSQSQIQHISVDNDRGSLLIYGKLAILNLEFTTIYSGKWTDIFTLPDGVEAGFESLSAHAYTATLSVRDSTARGGLVQISQSNPTKVQTYGGYGGNYWTGQLVFLVK